MLFVFVFCLNAMPLMINLMLLSITIALNACLFLQLLRLCLCHVFALLMVFVAVTASGVFSVCWVGGGVSRAPLSIKCFNIFVCNMLRQYGKLVGD